MINPDKILFIPSTRAGNGTGHLKRCLDWGNEWTTQNLYITDSGDNRMIMDHPLCRSRSNLKWHKEPGSNWDLIVLDNRSTETLPENLSGIPVLAVDESGPMRQSASYILDMIPGHNKNSSPYNRNAIDFLNRPSQKRNQNNLKKILISFGGEDPSGLSNRILTSLDEELLGEFEWTVIHPVSVKSEVKIQGVEYLGYVSNLSEELYNYDLVICSYGLTALEALTAGVGVLLINPGKYHDSLSRRTGIPFCPVSSIRKNRAVTKLLKANLLNRRAALSKKWEKLWEKYSSSEGLSFSDFIQSMTISSDCCPSCGSSNRTALSRFTHKSYFKCTNCSMKYMIHFNMKSDIYTKDYFFSEYKNQYGKTYLEDFPHIKKMAEERLKRIPVKKGNILDIGCAYGPFLIKAREMGFSSFGLEISEDAVGYIKKHFPDINVFSGDIGSIDLNDYFENLKFDVVSLWYVIEHFQNLKMILPQILQQMNPGGILALSTPHAGGISGLSNPSGFFKNSPDDHFSLWDRKSAESTLRRYGFKNIRFYITGHHPERFPAVLNKILPLTVRYGISKILGWGDTFEIYAEKG